MRGAESVESGGMRGPREAIQLDEATLQQHRNALSGPTSRLRKERVFDAAGGLDAADEVAGYDLAVLTLRRMIGRW